MSKGTLGERGLHELKNVWSLIERTGHFITLSDICYRFISRTQHAHLSLHENPVITLRQKSVTCYHEWDKGLHPHFKISSHSDKSVKSETWLDTGTWWENEGVKPTNRKERCSPVLPPVDTDRTPENLRLSRVALEYNWNISLKSLLSHVDTAVCFRGFSQLVGIIRSELAASLSLMDWGRHCSRHCPTGGLETWHF